MSVPGLALSGLLLGAATASPYTPQGEQERLAHLSPDHRAWLEEEVPYIITNAERDFFLALETLEERRNFMEAFWRKRDPDPASPVNEAREEHYRRLDFANRSLADDTTRPGWMTDRGRMFILLGQPRERQRFDGLNEIVSTELWFYQSEPGAGLPSFFSLVFFRPRDIGEYRLYHPALDGPRSLLRGRYASLDTTDPATIVVTLGDISPELSRASLSLDPSDPGDLITGRASLGTDILLDRIREAPLRRIRTDYLDAAIRYRDRISADYSFNFVPNRSAFRMLLAPDGGALVHYTVELDPQDMALQQDETGVRFYTIMDLSVDVRNPDGDLVHTEDREQIVDLSSTQMDAARASPFAFQGSFPLVSGDFEASVVLRNRTMRRFTVAEAAIAVPDPDGLMLSDPVLAFAVEADGFENAGAFSVGSRRLRPAADGLFSLGESLNAAVQVAGVRSGSTLRMTLLKSEQPVRERLLPAADFQDGGNYATFDLTGLDTGGYRFQVELLDPDGTLTAARNGPVRIIPRMVPRASYVHRSSADVSTPGLLALTRGNQFLALGRVEAARAELERAVTAAGPGLPMAQWRLASLVLRTEETDYALELLAPLESEHSDQYEVVAGLGFAHYLDQRFADAAPYLERAVSLRPPNIVLLNALGEAHEQTGDLERAVVAFERSLSLQPDQEIIERRLARIRANPR